MSFPKIEKISQSKFFSLKIVVRKGIRALTEICRVRVTRVTGPRESANVSFRVIIDVITAVVAHYGGNEIYKRFIIVAFLSRCIVPFEKHASEREVRRRRILSGKELRCVERDETIAR